MAQITVKQLRDALATAKDDSLVVFQGNVPNEDNESDPKYNEGEPAYTTTIGYVYSGFERTDHKGVSEFVIDGAITDFEL